MPYQIENRMVVDSEFGEIEYGVKAHRTLLKERRAYEQAELEMEDENYESIRNRTGNYELYRH